MRFYVDSGRTRRNGSEGHEDGLKVSGVHHEFQRSLVTQVQLPMRVLMRKDPDFAGPKATAIPMALPLREKRHYWKYFLKSVQKVPLR